MQTLHWIERLLHWLLPRLPVFLKLPKPHLHNLPVVSQWHHAYPIHDIGQHLSVLIKIGFLHLQIGNRLL